MWKNKKDKEQRVFNTERVLWAAKLPLDEVCNHLQTTSWGLTEEVVEKRQALYGKNEIVHEKREKPLIMLVGCPVLRS